MYTPINVVCVEYQFDGLSAEMSHKKLRAVQMEQLKQLWVDGLFFRYAHIVIIRYLINFKLTNTLYKQIKHFVNS